MVDSFKILSDSPKNLLEKLEIARRQVNNAKNREELLAILGYIYLLEDAIGRVFPDFAIPSSMSNNSKKDKAIDKKYSMHEEKMLNNFLEYKEFHKKLFEGLQKTTSHQIKRMKALKEKEEAKEKEETKEKEPSIISEADFYSILFDFMNKLGLSKTYDKFVKNKRIYSSQVELIDGVDGYTLCNPFSKDSDIFVDRMQYNIISMITLAHEFGHVYDINHFDGDIESYNKFIYESYNDEVISKTFESLFVDYLIENNILIDESTHQLYTMLDNNYEFILASYIIALIPEKYLIEGTYYNLTPTKVNKLVERYFSRNTPIRKFINKCSNFDIHETFRYAYGDIFSLFLKNRIKEDNYSLEPVKEFIKLREDSFSPDIFKKMNMDKKTYIKLYKKDIELLKKQSN